MRGHVQKKKGNWYVILELEPEKGVRQRRTISVRKELGLNRPAKKPEADGLLVNKLKELQDGLYFEPTKITVGELFDLYLKHRKPPSLKQTTWESYETMIRLHIKPEIGHHPLRRLRATHLDKLYQLKLQEGRKDKKPGGLSPTSVRYLHKIIYGALEYSLKREIIPRNVATLTDPPVQTSPEQSVWNAEQVQLFLQHIAEHRLYPLYVLALATGMRRGELIGLRWKDIDEDRGIISIRHTIVPVRKGSKQETPKNKQARSVKVSAGVIELLKTYRNVQEKELEALEKKNPQGLVFTSEAGTALVPRNLSRHFETTIARLNGNNEPQILEPIPFHSLRHTNATMLARAGVHMKVISGRLGHSSIAITDIYAHLVADMQDEAAASIDRSLFPENGGQNSGGTLH